MPSPVEQQFYNSIIGKALKAARDENPKQEMTNAIQSVLNLADFLLVGCQQLTSASNEESKESAPAYDSKTYDTAVLLYALVLTKLTMLPGEHADTTLDAICAIVESRHGPGYPYPQHSDTIHELISELGRRG